jgi:hypothetical protein
MKQLFIVLLAIILLVGCSTPKIGDWYKHKGTERNFKITMMDDVQKEFENITDTTTIECLCDLCKNNLAGRHTTGRVKKYPIPEWYQNKDSQNNLDYLRWDLARIRNENMYYLDGSGIYLCLSESELKEDFIKINN